MGWFHVPNDTPDEYEHEGFPIGVVRDDGSWRELTAEDGHVEVLHHVQIGCDCGWRSPIYTAPLGTSWSPCSVWWGDESDGDVGYSIWLEDHRQDVMADQRGAFLRRKRRQFSR